jgi:protein TonB
VSDRFASSSSRPWRIALIAGIVVALHAAALWALQNGLLRRVTEVVIPVQILAEFIEPPKPVEPPPPAPPPPKPQVKPEVKPKPVVRPKPRPVALSAPTPPTPDAPAAASEPTPPVETPAPTAPESPAPAPPAPPAPPASPVVQQPSTDADYAQDCKPAYPSMSKRIGEQGRVIVSVLVGADGRPKNVDIKQSSGFDRLDAAARQAMLRCRFVPGTVNGVARDMAYDAPVIFNLN